MNLASHGLRTYIPDVRVLSLSPDSNNLALYSDTGRTQQEIAKYSTKEAANYSGLQKTLANIAAVIDQLLHMTPPDIDDSSVGQRLRSAEDRPQDSRPWREGLLPPASAGCPWPSPIWSPNGSTLNCCVPP